MDGQRHLTEKQKKWIAGSGLALFFLLSLLICWFAGRPLIHFAQEPERFRQWVDAQGVLAPLLFTGMIILQVIVAVIPGEPLEIAAGYAFGAIEGTFLCVLGTFLGSMLVFLLVRRFGLRAVEIFFPVEKLRSRINGLEVDALTMNQESLAECIYHGKWFNPFPKFKYTERPDAAAAGILEGKVAVLVDNSPSAMLLPATLFDIMEEADDFYFPPVTGTYLKISRFLIGMLTLFLTPLWLLLMQNPQWIPPSLEFIKVREAVNVPLILQLLILELSIDGLKLAAINTPSMLTTPLSVIAALVIGEFTVKSGWFNAETMLYMAFVSIANYMQASYELSYAFKFMRILLLLLTWAFQAWGLAAGVVLLCILVAGNKTVSGESYLYPLFPFDGRQLARRLLRRRISFEHMEKR